MSLAHFDADRVAGERAITPKQRQERFGCSVTLLVRLEDVDWNQVAHELGELASIAQANPDSVAASSQFHG